jgi:hypothetical protein
MKALLASLALITIVAGPARADREVTEAERSRLEAALKAQGCTGTKFHWDEDDREFEVDDARCADGKKYDMNFAADYTLKSKKLDD